MEKLATILRFMQLYAHAAHNLVGGPTFLQDHPYLGELYPLYEEAYDSIIERMLGLGDKPNLIKVHTAAVKELSSAGLPESFEEAYEVLLTYEQAVCAQIEELCPQSSEGTAQLIGGMADLSEARQYKLKKRLGQ